MGSVPEGPNLSSSYQKRTWAFPSLGEVGSRDPENQQLLELGAPALSSIGTLSRSLQKLSSACPRGRSF